MFSLQLRVQLISFMPAHRLFFNERTFFFLLETINHLPSSYTTIHSVARMSRNPCLSSALSNNFRFVYFYPRVLSSVRGNDVIVSLRSAFTSFVPVNYVFAPCLRDRLVDFAGLSSLSSMRFPEYTSRRSIADKS